MSKAVLYPGPDGTIYVTRSDVFWYKLTPPGRQDVQFPEADPRKLAAAYRAFADSLDRTAREIETK
jgi:hypothetical protein